MGSQDFNNLWFPMVINIIIWKLGFLIIKNQSVTSCNFYPRVPRLSSEVAQDMTKSPRSDSLCNPIDATLLLSMGFSRQEWQQGGHSFSRDLQPRWNLCSGLEMRRSPGVSFTGRWISRRDTRDAPMGTLKLGHGEDGHVTPKLLLVGRACLKL